MQTANNPLREGLTSRPQPKPCSLVIFGATGDLTHRKLIPALYNLAADGDLPADMTVIGFARRDKPDDVFRTEMEEATRKFSRQPVKDEVWNHFAESLYYHRSAFDDDAGYKALAERLDKIDAERGTGGRRLFYLAAGPEQFEPIISRLKNSGLHNPGKGDGGGSRVVVEKPFGTDLKSARHLNEIVSKAFHESSTYRIDHFLGKETAQNIMVLRFANAIFEPIWNSRYIDHIEITAAETLGVEGRAGYYETSGALRDMVQNHLIQLLTLVCMEPPTDLRADSVRDEKVKVLRSLRQMNGPEDVAKHVVRGQYSAGAINGQPAPAYREEQNIKPGSMTETFVAMRVLIDNWRWSGVPIYVRVGKRLPKSGAEISVHFKQAPSVLFNQATAADASLGSNVLVIRIQPDEGVSLRIQSKLPGAALRVEPVKMDFQYGASFGKASPEAYERLLLDAMSGDPTLFARRDEVEEAWQFVDVIEEAWHGDTDGSKTNAEGPADAPGLFEYAAGSWGPKEADDLLAQDGRSWRRF
jgi:glucose-6-phosphate 1-dehydrogenase